MQIQRRLLPENLSQALNSLRQYFLMLPTMTKLKSEQRRIAYDARNNQASSDAFSQIICEKFISQPFYQQANTVMWYINCRSEVRTQAMILRELATSKTVVIPYCTKNKQGQNSLGLWHLQSFDELVFGTWGILEPPRHRWGESGKEIHPGQLDCILVPGVAFDRQGGRLGNGGGYYDRLLACVRPDTVLAAACYESQLFEQIVMEPHDVPMDYVITEKNIYAGIGRKSAD
jgi:5-formyltetrahydrofolate cyclo-ligase